MKHRYVDGSSIGRKINDTQTIEKTPTNIDTHTHGEIRVGRRRCRELDAQIKDVSAQVRHAQVNRLLSVRNELLFYHIWAENIHGSSHERASADRPRGRPATCTTCHVANPPRARPATGPTHRVVQPDRAPHEPSRGMLPIASARVWRRPASFIVVTCGRPDLRKRCNRQVSA